MHPTLDLHPAVPSANTIDANPAEPDLSEFDVAELADILDTTSTGPSGDPASCIQGWGS
jgi:hypothetical protein